MNGRLGLVGGGLVLGGMLLIGASTAFGGNIGGSAGMMGGGGGAGMMGNGGGGMMGGGGAVAPGPGQAGFVAGTVGAPRVVRILATPDLRFTPAVIRVQAGETVRFDVTAMGPTAHELMVGPAADVAADRAGTPEASDIGMMQTKSITYTFEGDGPFAFACHVTGHYEAGMRGVIEVVR